MPDKQQQIATKELTLLQQAALNAVLSGTATNWTQAAKVAGYKGNDNALGRRGWELARNSKIKEALEQQRRDIRAESLETSAHLTSDARNLYSLCLEKGQLGNAIRCLAEIAKLNGCYEQPKANKEQEQRTVEQRQRNRELALLLEDALDKQYNSVKLIESTATDTVESAGRPSNGPTMAEQQAEAIIEPTLSDLCQIEPKPPNGTPPCCAGESSPNAAISAGLNTEV